MRRTRSFAFAAVPALLATLLLAGCSNPEQEKQEYFTNANAFLAQKKYSEAIVEYRNAIRIDEKFGEARFKLAEAYEASGNANGAYNEYIRAADLMPSNLPAQLKAAQFLLLAGQFLDAKTRAERVLAGDAKNVEAQILVGNALAGMKDMAGAIEQLEEAIKLEPGRSQSYTNLAMLRMVQGDRDQAAAAFQRAVELDPKSVTAWLALANFQFSTNQPTEAEQSLKRALQIDATNVLANRALATLYSSTNRTMEAEAPLKVLADKNPDPQFKLALADYYLVADRVNEAKGMLEPLLGDARLAPAAGSRLAAIDYVKDKAAGHKRLDDVLAKYGDAIEPQLIKARWLLVDKKPAEALKHAQAAATIDNGSTVAHYLVGVAQMDLRQNAAAIAAFNEVLRLNPRASAAQLLLSRLHLADGATDTAVTMAQDALTNAPNNPDARVALARSLIARGELERAATEIAALLQQFPKAGVVHALDGAIRLRRKDLEGARRAFETALQLTPNAVEALGGATRVDLAQGRIPQARQRIEARIAAEPNNAELHFIAASVSAAEKNLPKAEQSLRKVIELNPAYSPGYSMLAGVLLAQRKLDAARDEFDRMATRDPKNVGAQTMAAMIVHANNVAEAKKRYQQILNQNPGAAVAANNLAWIYAEEGANLDEALRLAQTATTQLPENAAALDTLGWVYFRKDMAQQAIEPFEKSVAQEPDNPSYHYHLALALQKAGNIGRARASAQRAVQLKPDYAEAQKLLASIKG